MELLRKKVNVMKRLLFLFAIFMACGIGASAQRPLTQYFLVQAGEYGASFREASDMARVLKSLGFVVNMPRHVASDDEDPMAEYTILSASRKGTRLTLNNGEDVECVIDFANQKEVDDFVNSLAKAGYRKRGTLYEHPRNRAGFGMIYVRVAGRRVKLIRPFEMLPYDF